MPLPLKNWAIDTFGTSDKVVLVVTTLFLVFLAGIAIGGLMLEGRRVAASIGCGLISAAGVFAVLTRPDPTLGKIAPILVGGIVSLAVLWWLAPRLHQPGGVAAPVEAVATVGDTSGEPALSYTPMIIPGFGSTDRRQFLTRGVGAGVDRGHRRRSRAPAAAPLQRRERARRPRPAGGLGPPGCPAAEHRFRRAWALAVRDAERRVLPDRHRAGRAAGVEGRLEAAHPRDGRQRAGADVRRPPRP